MPKMTDEDIVRGRGLRAKGMTWEAIGRELGFTPETIRIKIDPTFNHGARLANKRAAWRRRQTGAAPARHVVRAERFDPTYDPRRDGAREHASIDAELMGDPPIGRSALDQKRAPPPAEN